MATTYYHIMDLNRIGKSEDHTPYIYDLKKGWVEDSANVLMDRIMGYDETEPDDSPYKIGNSSIMDCVKQISEDEMKSILGID